MRKILAVSGSGILIFLKMMLGLILIVLRTSLYITKIIFLVFSLLLRLFGAFVRAGTP